MKKNIFKGIIVLVTPILILSIMTCFSIKDIPEYLYTNDELQVISSLKNVAPFANIKYKKSIIKMSMFRM